MSGISMVADAKVGVTVEIAATRGASARPTRRAYSTLDTTSAAAPSEVAQTSISRSGLATIGDAATSAAVKRLR